MGTNMVNVPIAAYTRGPAIRDVIEDNWMPRLDAFQPQMIFVSAGFDAHREDDLGQLGLVEADYEWITTPPDQDLAARHAQGPDRVLPRRRATPQALARSVAAHLRVLAGGESSRSPRGTDAIHA